MKTKQKNNKKNNSSFSGILFGVNGEKMSLDKQNKLTY